jgi:hypothetical protein
MSQELLMVGSVPLETASEVLATFGKPLGRFLRSIPDGEVGPRRYWISRVHWHVFALHPDLEIVQRPRRDDGVERLVPHDDRDGWMFQVRQGVERVAFGDPGWRLGYAFDALNSHFVFRTHFIGMPLSHALYSMRMISRDLLPELRKAVPKRLKAG